MTTIIYPAVERRFGLIEVMDFLKRFDLSDDNGKKILASSPESLEVLDWGSEFHLDQRRGLIEGRYWRFYEYSRRLNIKS